MISKLAEQNEYMESTLSSCKIWEIEHITIGPNFNTCEQNYRKKQRAWWEYCKYGLYKVGKAERVSRDHSTTSVKGKYKIAPDAHCYMSWMLDNKETGDSACD